MPKDGAELSERIARAAPTDQARGAIFFPVIDILNVECSGHPRLAPLCERFGRSALQPLNFYPTADWLVLLWEACEVLEPELGFDGAMAMLGAETARQILGSLLGRLIGRRVRLLTPLERVVHAPTVYGTSVSYGARTVERLDARRVRMRFERELVPAAFHVAAIQALLVGTPPCDVWPTETGLLEFSLEISVADTAVSV